MNNLFKYLLVFLIFFLPISSWMVSLSGIRELSLLRDAIVLILFLIAIPKIKPKYYLLIVGLFVLYALFSYFWREASTLQWLRGLRFTALPLLLFLAISSSKLKDQKAIHRSVLYSAILVLVFSLFELSGFKLPLTSRFSAEEGALATSFVSGNSGMPRLQSVMAGPNALGLYLLAIAAFFIAFPKLYPKIILPISFLVLVFTFSRSALIGFIVFLSILLFSYFFHKFGKAKALISSTVILFALIFGGYLICQNPKFNDYVFHGTSNKFRIEQYQRIYDSRNEIGLFGRGFGTAGPSSQFRLDNGPNHWTENIYLDIFEELGLIGLILYLLIIGSMLVNSAKNFHLPEGKAAFLSLASFSVSGIFINYYTGQAGIFLIWLALGLLVQKNYDITTKQNKSREA